MGQTAKSYLGSSGAFAIKAPYVSCIYVFYDLEKAAAAHLGPRDALIGFWVKLNVTFGLL